jgi:hypothetical protein
MKMHTISELQTAKYVRREKTVRKTPYVMGDGPWGQVQKHVLSAEEEGAQSVRREHRKLPEGGGT